MTESIHLFVYGRSPWGDFASDPVRDASVQGTLFEVEGIGSALLLSGHATVSGEIRRVPASALDQIDARARVREGLYRRVGVQVGETPCWTWVAGPKLGPRLAFGSRKRGVEGV